jgi:hypothetical protein
MPWAPQGIAGGASGQRGRVKDGLAVRARPRAPQLPSGGIYLATSISATRAFRFPSRGLVDEAPGRARRRAGRARADGLGFSGAIRHSTTEWTRAAARTPLALNAPFCESSPPTEKGRFVGRSWMHQAAEHSRLDRCSLARLFHRNALLQFLEPVQAG